MHGIQQKNDRTGKPRALYAVPSHTENGTKRKGQTDEKRAQGGSGKSAHAAKKKGRDKRDRQTQPTRRAKFFEQQRQCAVYDADVQTRNGKDMRDTAIADGFHESLFDPVCVSRREGISKGGLFFVQGCIQYRTYARAHRREDIPAVADIDRRGGTSRRIFDVAQYHIRAERAVPQSTARGRKFSRKGNFHPLFTVFEVRIKINRRVAVQRASVGGNIGQQNAGVALLRRRQLGYRSDKSVFPFPESLCGIRLHAQSKSAHAHAEQGKTEKGIRDRTYTFPAAGK